MRRVLFLLAAALATAQLADAATLKPYGTLKRPVVYLSDLWDGVSADKPLGPGPAPGGRITVPSAQLAAIARQFGVDWQPDSTADQVILERPGRAIGGGDIKPVLQAAILGSGAAPGTDLEISGFTAPLIAVNAHPNITVAQFELDKVSGRFSALLEIPMDDAPNTELRVTGRIRDMVDVPVARRRIMPGEIVTAADLQWAHVPRALTRGEFVQIPANAIGLAAKDTITPNQPIPLAELGHPVIVHKGDRMILTLDSPGLSLTAQGVATEPGGMSEHIRVINQFTRTSVEVEIVAPGEARIVPGTARPTNRFMADR